MSHSSAHDDAAHPDGDEAHSAVADAHDDPVPEEPKTPLWLMALGGGLFFVFAVLLLVGLTGEPSAAEPAPATSASAAVAVPSSPPPARPAAPPPAPPPIVAPPAPIPAPPPPIPPPPSPGGSKPVKKTPK